MQILAELSDRMGSDTYAKGKLLEVGYYIKQSQIDKSGGTRNRDSEDNARLHEENQRLINDNLKLCAIVNESIPNIQEGMRNIIRTFERIEERIKNMQDVQKTLT